MVNNDSMSLTKPLPDFSAGASLLILMLAIMGLSLIITLAGLEGLDAFWADLGKVALFLLWAALLSAVLFSIINRYCARLPVWMPVVIGFVCVQLLVFAMTIAVMALQQTGMAATESLLERAATPLVRNLGISVIVTAFVLRLWALHQQWAVQVRSEAEATMRSLQARIHPHFLFNTLNTISSLIQEKPAQAEQATLDLSDLLRSGLSEQTHHSLQDELDLIRGYLRIEQLRLGDRLTVDWQLAEDLPLDQELPALLIQPLVENAIIHGIARLPSGGTLRIAGELHRRQRMRFVIENPVPAEGESDEKPGNRMALDNVGQRLALAWDEGARLKTQQEKGRFRAELVLPISF